MGRYSTGSALLVDTTLTPLPELTLSTSVTIGGAPAVVQYAGPMVGGILGLLQINVVVPDASTRGATVPVSVDIGGIPTQAGVTLVVK
jgi:uncharacterized protein (TIGR03437 family)